MNKRLLHEIRLIRVHLAVTAALTAAMGGLIVAQDGALTRVINGAFLGRQDVSQLIGVLIAFLMVIIGRSLLIWGNAAIAARGAAIVKTSLRTRLFAHLQMLGPLYLVGERSGELTTTMGEGIESIDAFFSQLMPQAFASVLIPLIIGLVALAIDPLSGLILLLTTPVLLVFMYLLGTMAAEHTRKQWGQLSRMSAHFLDVLQGLTTLKLFGRSQAQRETIGRMSDLFRATTMDVLRVAFLSSLVLEMGATISTAMVAVEIGLRLLYNQMAFAPAFFVLLLAPDFYLPLRTLGAKFHASMSGSASAQRVYEILDTPIANAAQPTLHTANISTSIDFRNVTYAYHDKNHDDHPALHHVSFSIGPGQKVALVGPSGAGKSTVANFLLRFTEPQAGEIVIGGTPLSTIPARVWREQIAWIPQRPSLFNTSVAENIRMGRPDATSDEIIAAARQAQIHDFIETLPDGYETIVGERGTRLSGGQAQRLAIARAILKDAPILLLDEATAHLDHANEQAVLDALQTLMQGRTALIIAHHLHTVRAADRIILLESGQIATVGMHEQLLASSRAYRELAGVAERGLAI